MKLPHQIQMAMLMHGSGAKGMSVYVYGNHEHGVYQTSRRESRNSSFVSTFEYTGLPDMAFTSYAELIEAAETVTPEQLATEKAKWPKLVSVEPTRPMGVMKFQNRCRLCPRGPVTFGVMTEPERRPEQHRVHIAVDHVGVNDWHFGLCDEHLPMTKDVPALVTALLAEVQARRDSVTSKLFNEADKP